MLDRLRHSRGPVDWSDTVSSASDRVHLIVDAANRVAAEIREDAEAQAREYVEEARRRAEALTSERVAFISEASKSLLEQGRIVKAHSDELVEALHEAALRVNAAVSEIGPLRDPGEPTPAPMDPPRPRETPPATRNRRPEPPADPAPPGVRESQAAREPQAIRVDPSALGTDDRELSDGPRLLAMRMAVAGSSPTQVEARLREVGVEDPVRVVDAVFGDA